MPFNLTIVTAEREVLSEDVDSVTVPGALGEMTILPNHAAVFAQLVPGEMTIRRSGQETPMAVTGGFLEILGNRVVMLADAAERDEEIDVQRAEEALQRAQENVRNRGADVDLEQALRAVQRAQVRVRVARRRGGRRRESTDSGSA